jgi:diguanylate cyclase (GGDEF)-like protein
MAAYIDLEVEVLAFLACLILLVDFHKNIKRLPDSILFKLLLIAVMAQLVFEGLILGFTGKTFQVAKTLLMVFNGLYYFQSALISFIWVLYADYKMFGDIKGLRYRCIAYSMPFIAAAVMGLGSIWTGWVFNITSENEVARGSIYTDSLFFTQTYLCLAMVLYTWVLSLVKASKAKTARERRDFLLIGSFVYLPIIGGFVQVQPFAKGVPLLWPLTSLSLMMIYINIQSSKISQDFLTMAYNQRMLDQYLASSYKNLRVEESLYLLKIDIDGFTKINETYGKDEGDRDLIALAKILAKISGQEGLFLAREEGSRFSYAFVDVTDEKANELVEKISDALYQAKKEKKFAHPFTVAMGYAKVGLDVKDALHVLDLTADSQLYLNKKETDAEQVQPAEESPVVK